MYVELHAASAFSFLEGASTPEALVDRAAVLGYPALALLDRDGVYGAPRFHQAARAAGLRPIVGAELTIRAGGRSARAPAVPGTAGVLGWPPVLWRLPVLVASREGYRNLCRLITRLKLSAPKGQGALTLDDLDGSTAGLVALVGRPAVARLGYGVGGLLDRIVGLFGRANVYVELQRHFLCHEEADNEALLSLASAFRVPVVATGGVRFATEADRPLADVLTCIRHHTNLEQAGRRLAWNAERHLKSPDQMAELFDDLPHAVAAARDLADRLEYTMADLGYRFPSYPVPEGETEASFLRKVTEAGARDRYRPYHARARAQIQRELDLIERLDLAGYFLIVWDIVNFCRQQGILVQGRGSAANSAVCYSLGITAVDPVGMDLLFERFLSEERGEWPDIDLDLPSGDRRERVIQYVYERYGRLGAAMTANVITYRSRSAAREVGKALGMPAEIIDRLARLMVPFEWRDPAETLARHLADAGLDAADPRIRQFADLWARIQDLPRHLGQHSGGMVICQGRLDEIVPLEPATMPGRVVIQWDKEDCADMGLVKVDLLGLGMMAVLQDALTIVNARRAEAGGCTAAASLPPADDMAPVEELTGEAADRGPLDLAHLPPDDPAVYRMLQEADTIGVFQVESRAQMATLPRLKPARFYDIVVEVALIRPGPIVGQMVHPYLRRRAGLEPVTCPHPLLEPILERTLGVPLFQEQLLRMAMAVAGFTGGEAEELRRAMGFKRSEARMRKIEEKLRAGMAARGITGEAADTIVRSIGSFALYGFPESHAASFALLVYASAYLKAHYPAAFTAALLNNQPMGFYHPATIVKDAQRHGVRFKPIDVQASDWLCRVDEDGAIRLGLCYVRGLREAVGRRIEGSATEGTDGARQEESRAGETKAGGTRAGGDHAPAGHCVMDGGRGGDAEAADHRGAGGRRFRSLDHFVAATGVRHDELAVLAEIGALNAFGYDRRSALWQIERAVRPAGALFEAIEERGDEDASADAPWGGERAAGPEPARDPAGARQEAGAERREPVLGEGVEDPASGSGGPDQDGMAGRAGRASPLAPMNAAERLVADYAGTGLTIGPHPMAFRRGELALGGVLRACDLARARAGRRVRVAGAVITRQRPGTAKGFTFLTLEDETGISNVIVRPDLFDAARRVIVEEPFLLVEGVLQQQDGVTAIKAERLLPLPAAGPAAGSHDFR
jgi:error-prone DNA polymerase